MEKEIKILVCAHREAALPPHKYFYPIQVGAALTNTRFYHAQDNTGDNISDKNPHFCELTAHYWAWKNIRCDIIGLNITDVSLISTDRLLPFHPTEVSLIVIRF